MVGFGEMRECVVGMGMGMCLGGGCVSREA